MRRPSSGHRIVIAIFSLGLLAGCMDSPDVNFLDPEGYVAQQQRVHFWRIVALMGLVVGPILVLTPLIAYRYRFSGNSTYTPDWHFSWIWEAAIWGGPIVIVTILSYFLWQNTTALDPFEPLPIDGEPVRVQVVGYDWKWLFIYPDHGIATLDELVFPEGRPLNLELTSETVMQSFHIPVLGGQVYAMEGMVSKLHLAADRPGVFRGRNTQYNGHGFHRQQFVARALPETAFSAWLDTTSTEARPWSDAVHDRIAERSTLQEMTEGDDTGAAFRDVPGDLFSGIVGPMDRDPDWRSRDRRDASVEAGPADGPVATATVQAADPAR